MSEIKSEYRVLNEQNEYDTHFLKTSADQVVGLGRMKSFSYAVGDVVYTDNNMRVALKCTTAGTTSDSELDISTANIGDSVADGGVVWQVCNRTSDVTSVNGNVGDVIVDLPVGFVYWSVEPTVPTGRVPALGALYNRSLYADLWDYALERDLVKTESEWQTIAGANDGNCAYYSSGDGSTTFRVPKLPNTIASDVPSEVPVVGNGMTMGLTNGTSNAGLYCSSGTTDVQIGKNMYGQPIGYSDGGTNSTELASYGVTTDSTKSGIVAKTSATKITGQWLIVAFGVAHNIGEADVANVMQAVEQVQTSVGTLEQGVGTAIDYIVESYRNGTEWYEVYKSGKVRQGGYITRTSSYGAYTITLLKSFANTNYTITATNSYSSAIQCYALNVSGSITQTSFTLGMTGSGWANAYWVAEGQGA